MKNVEFKMDVSIPLEAIEEVLITALEGGSNYVLDGWARRIRGLV